jgi:hypothetical protein
MRLYRKHFQGQGIQISGGIAPYILNLGTSWIIVFSFTPRPLCSQEKSRQYQLNKTLGGTQSRSGRFGEDKNINPLPGFEPQISIP